MVEVERGSVEKFFADVPLGLQVYDVLTRLVDRLGPAGVRVTKSQVAFRRRTGFCWVWLPGMYLSRPGAEVVVSLALPREDQSARWKQVVRVAGRTGCTTSRCTTPPTSTRSSPSWLREAYASAG